MDRFLIPIKDELKIAGSTQRKSTDSDMHDKHVLVTHEWLCSRWEMMGQKKFARMRLKSVVLRSK